MPNHDHNCSCAMCWPNNWGQRSEEDRTPLAVTLVERMANRFVEILRGALDEQEWAELLERNRQETNRSVCHSHDFCDANMAMHEAFVEVMRREPDVSTAVDTEFWNMAWEHAMPQLGGKR